MTERRLHLALLGVWMLLGIPTLLFWSESLVWVVAMSWYAIVASHWAGYAAGRAEDAVKDNA